MESIVEAPLNDYRYAAIISPSYARDSMRQWSLASRNQLRGGRNRENATKTSMSIAIAIRAALLGVG
jgi:hypothetical protein